VSRAVALSVPLPEVGLLFVVTLSTVWAAAPQTLVFDPVSHHVPDGLPYGVSAKATLNGRPHELRFQEILRAGDQPGSSPVPFGQLSTTSGEAFSPGRPPFSDLCDQIDYTAIQEAHGKIWMWNHFECVRGEIFLTELQQDTTTGTLTAVHTQPVGSALATQGGVYSPCAGDITDWGTLLSSEEYEPDARYWDHEAGRMTDEYWFSQSVNHLSTAFESTGDAHPYRFGWAPELRIDNQAGRVTGEKHYAMGRFSHELSRVLPDRRTVLQSDDGWGVGLFLFVADVPEVLSAGHLYAAQWTLDHARAGGAGRLDWVPLGHASNDDIQPLVESAHPVQFEELFTRAEVSAGGQCPLGFSPVFAFGITECLKLAAPSERVPNPAQAASRLETRRYAGLLGATTEFKKGEGLASTASGRTVYYALSDISGSMTAGSPPPPAADTVRLPANHCGGVYAGQTSGSIRDTTGALIDSEFVPWELHAVVVGKPQSRTVCHPSGIANPDNVTFLPAYDLLAIAEDTRRAPDGLWMWDRHLDTLTRVMLAPPEAEVAGLSVVEDLGGFDYLTVSLQTPGTDRDEAEPFDRTLQGRPYGVIADDHRSVVGVLGPLPTGHP